MTVVTKGVDREAIINKGCAKSRTRTLQLTGQVTQRQRGAMWRRRGQLVHVDGASEATFFFSGPADRCVVSHSVTDSVGRACVIESGMKGG